MVFFVDLDNLIMYSHVIYVYNSTKSSINTIISLHICMVDCLAHWLYFIASVTSLLSMVVSQVQYNPCAEMIRVKNQKSAFVITKT